MKNNNKNIFSLNNQRCRTWKDCTNPQYDCINCPLRYNGGSNTISTTDIAVEYNDNSEIHSKLCHLTECASPNRDSCYGCPYQGYEAKSAISVYTNSTGARII